MSRLACCVLILLSVHGFARAQASLDKQLEPYLSRYELPALAAAVVLDGKIVAAGAVGTRRVGTNAPVTLNDRFHLGSDTKAMTAMLAGMLVDEGKLKWSSTLADVFPELTEKIDPRLRKVTLEQFLSHSSGVPVDDDALNEDTIVAMAQPGNLDEMRYWLVKKRCGVPLKTEPGKKFAYANMNYVFAGAMIERVAGKTWEELIVDRIFTPFELKTAGLGPQSSVGRIDAPLGHEIVKDKPQARLAGPNGDNPVIIAPAGIAHMSVLDFARWAGWHAGQGKRGPQLVKPDTVKKLQTMIIAAPEKKDAPPGTPKLGRYGLGMGELVVDWAPKPVLYHGGSNTMNLAHIWIDPEHDFGMVTMTNVGGKKADEALFKLAEQLYKEYAPKK